MEIKKGKLYYNHQLECVIKAQTDYEDKSGLHSDKIAVHCPTKEDWDYVVSIVDNGCGYDYNSYKSESVIFLDSGMYGSLNGITNERYHTITIEQFKQF